MAQPARKRRAGHCEPHHAIQAAHRLFGGVPDFSKAGTHTDEHRLTLHFHFPGRAHRYQKLMEKLSADTGWSVEVSPRVAHQKLTEAVRDSLPLTWEMGKISVFPGEPRVRVRVRFAPDTTEQDKTEASGRFEELTGYSLELEEMAPPKLANELFDAQGRMEHNAAFTTIKQRFQELGVAPPRCGFKSESGEQWLEVRFITPLVARRHKDVLEELSNQIGWEIRVRKSPDQKALARLTKQLIPSKWKVKGQPGVCAKENSLRVRALGRPSWEDVRQVSERLEQETGFRLMVSA